MVFCSLSSLRSLENGISLCRVFHKIAPAGYSLSKITYNYSTQSTTRLKLANGCTAVFDNISLRDACCCPQCVDRGSKQKTFSTTDISADVHSESVQETSGGDVESYGKTLSLGTKVYTLLHFCKIIYLRRPAIGIVGDFLWMSFSGILRRQGRI